MDCEVHSFLIIAMQKKSAIECHIPCGSFESELIGMGNVGYTCARCAKKSILTIYRPTVKRTRSSGDSLLTNPRDVRV